MARLETQVIRFKTASETAERSEEELKTERRKLQREVSIFVINLFTVVQKIKKSPGQIKLVNSNKSISRNLFLTKFHFLQFQK